MPSQRRLLASIHDVAPAFEGAVDQLCERLDRHLGGPRFAMLVVPEHWAGAPISRSPAFAARLRSWSDAGIEMFVHGWYHRDTADHRGWQRFKARHFTAGEGEFLGLSEAEALRRIRDGIAVVEDATGRAAAGFIAPAWLYGAGAQAALGRSGLPLAEDHWRVWAPATGRILARGPVITWASRSEARAASSRAVAALARLALRAPSVRIAVHPGDAARPDILQSVDATLRHFTHTHRPARYADLLG